MKPLLKGNLPELWKQKAFKVRKLKTGTFVEYVVKYESLPERYGDDRRYCIEVCGITIKDVPCAGSPAEWANCRIFWQYADRKAVEEVLADPIKAYDWIDVKNGYRKKEG